MKFPNFYRLEFPTHNFSVVAMIFFSKPEALLFTAHSFCYDPKSKKRGFVITERKTRYYLLLNGQQKEKKKDIVK